MAGTTSSRFQVEVDQRLLSGNLVGKTKEVSLLMLHGGGNADKTRFGFLQNQLGSHHISSAAFDFAGWGQSTGKREDSSLKNHTCQACRVIEFLGMKQPLSILGASMGAYTAVRLLEVFPIANLILFVPAMYARQAYALPFGNTFKKTISAPESWINSDAWELLSDFKGHLFVVTAEHDKVIPTDVIQRIFQSADRAHSRTIMTIKGAPHKILNFLETTSPEDTSEIVKAIATLLTATAPVV